MLKKFQFFPVLSLMVHGVHQRTIMHKTVQFCHHDVMLLSKLKRVIGCSGSQCIVVKLGLLTRGTNWIFGNENETTLVKLLIINDNIIQITVVKSKNFTILTLYEFILMLENPAATIASASLPRSNREKYPLTEKNTL